MPTVSGTKVFPADSMGNQNNLQPVAIDPLMIGALPSAANIGTFAQANAQLTMPRLTLNSTVSMAAQQACMLEDDMSFTLTGAAPNSTTIVTTNPDALPFGGYNSAGTKREFVGQYTWLATLVPVYGDLQPTETSNLMYMSIVVFNKRQFSIPPASANPPTERACQVTAVAGSGFGGGDLTISGGSATRSRSASASVCCWAGCKRTCPLIRIAEKQRHSAPPRSSARSRGRCSVGTES